jgi:hypothetical protein
VFGTAGFSKFSPATLAASVVTLAKVLRLTPVIETFKTVDPAGMLNKLMWSEPPA